MPTHAAHNPVVITVLSTLVALLAATLVTSGAVLLYRHARYQKRYIAREFMLFCAKDENEVARIMRDYPL